MKRAAVLLLLAACAKGDHRRTSVDIPVLPTDTGTAPVDMSEPLVTIKNGHPDVDLSSIERWPMLFAMERGLPLGALSLLLDSSPWHGHELDMMVRVGDHERMIVLELPKASAGSSEVRTVMRIDMTTRETRVNGVVQPVVAPQHGVHIVLVAATEVTMQQLAEVVAAAGGRVALGAGADPQEPEPAPPP